MPEGPSAELLTKLAFAGASERGLLHFLLENIPDRIYFKDRECRFIRISRAMAQFFGLATPLEAVGKSDFDFFTREHAQPAFDDEQEIMRTGQPIVGKIEKETLPDGRTGWVITTKMPLRNAQGEIIGTCGISKDFTAQKALEDALATSNEELKSAHENLKAIQEQLLEAEKMRTAGRLAYGVAHEVRNPLNILHAGIDYLSSDPAFAASPNAPVIEEMKSAIRRADAVVSALMDSTTEGNFQLDADDVRELIDHALEGMARDGHSDSIEVVKEYADDFPPLLLDRNKMGQVIEGLLKNATEAMVAGGKLTIRTHLASLEAEEIEQDHGLHGAARFHPGERVAVIEIDDTGPGIPKETLPNIFDPFFTTRVSGIATGMGLTVARKIVELHRGLLHVKNREQGGVRATLIFKLDGI